MNALLSIICACLLAVTSSKRNDGGYSDSYVFLTVRNTVTGQETEVCANYLQYKTTPISPTVAEATPVRLGWWRNLTNMTNICPLPSGREKSISYSNKAVALKYRIDDDGTSCSRRFNETTFRDASQFQVAELKKNGAKTAVFLVDEGRQFVTKWRDYLFADFFDPYINITTAIPTFFLYSRVFQDIIEGSNGQIESLELLFHRPPDSSFDLSLVFIWLLAVGCVTGGGTWAFFRHRAGKDKSSLHALASSASDEEEADTTDNWCSRCCGRYANTFVIVFLMIMLVTVLMLGFYFRPILVTFFNIMLVVFGSFSVYGCANAFLSNFRCCNASPCSTSMCSLFPELGCISHRPTVSSVILYVISLTVCITWFVLRTSAYAFILLDFINVTLCLHILKSLRLPSLKWIATLMVCMFVYDAVMVFVTPLWTKSGCSVMLEVATGGDCPTDSNVGYPVPPIDANPPEKFPMLMQVMHLNPMLKCVDIAVEKGYQMTILGLGDIIIPGYLVTHCFTMNGFEEKARIVYGLVCIVGYGAALVITFFALTVMNMAQPALIYLVPGTLIPICVLAGCRNELRKMWDGVPELQAKSLGETGVPDSVTVGDDHDSEEPQEV